MRELIHIYGPISIYSYGVAIAIGLLIFMWFIQRDEQFKKLNLENNFLSIVSVGLFAAFFGARLLDVINSPTLNFSDFFAFWDGGFSVLGGIISLLIILPLYLHIIHVPILPFTDLVAVYAAIIQSFGRIGCFFAGCCYGMPTKIAWAVCYTDSNTSAPVGIWMHPTQLYSSALLLGIFLLMYFVLQYKLTKPGQLTTMYLMLVSAERFFVEFWRADKVFFANPALSFLSINQFIGLSICTVATIAFAFFTFRTRRS